MRLFGFHIEREKGVRLGSYSNAIVDLQERIAKLEYRRGVQVQKDEARAVEQSEIEKVLQPGALPAESAGSVSDSLYATL